MSVDSEKPAPSGLIAVVVVNAPAYQQLKKLSAGYIADQKAKHLLTEMAGPLEPDTQGFVTFTTYRRDVAEILVAPLRALGKEEYVGLIVRKFFTNQDPKKLKRYERKGGKKRNSNRKSRSNGSVDLSDTGSVGSNDSGFSIGSSYSRKSSRSNRSTRSDKSINLEGAKWKRFAVFIDGKGISKRDWESETPPPGGQMNWWMSRNRRKVKCYINFESAAARDRWYNNHMFISVDGQDRKVHVLK